MDSPSGEVWLDLRIEPTSDGFLHASRDITDVHRARLALEESERRYTDDLRTFSHSISHDLKGPVRAIASFAALILRSSGATMSESDRHRLENIVEAGETMGRLIEDLSAYTKVGLAAVHAEPVPMASMASSLRAMLAVRLEETGGVIMLDEHAATPVGDPSLLERILLNLADHALSYARPGVPPVVRIAAIPEGGSVAIEVADNGIGIASDSQEGAFQVFTRLHADPQSGHSGIGLAVARRAARAMGTDLTMTSRPGEGTTFRLVLPSA